MDNQTPEQSEMIAISRRRAFALATKLGLASAALSSGLSTAFAAEAPFSSGLRKKSYKSAVTSRSIATCPATRTSTEKQPARSSSSGRN